MLEYSKVTVITITVNRMGMIEIPIATNVGGIIVVVLEFKPRFHTLYEIGPNCLTHRLATRHTIF